MRRNRITILAGLLPQKHMSSSQGLCNEGKLNTVQHP